MGIFDWILGKKEAPVVQQQPIQGLEGLESMGYQRTTFQQGVYQEKVKIRKREKPARHKFYRYLETRDRVNPNKVWEYIDKVTEEEDLERKRVARELWENVRDSDHKVMKEYT